MRQAGILAAAGLYALENHVERLADDHANALRFALGLEKLGIAVDPAPETNMVLFRVEQTRQFATELHKRSLLINPVGGARVPGRDTSRCERERHRRCTGSHR